jgi:hypothetical protein
MSRTGSLFLALTLFGALAGCRSSAEPATADDSVFVKTMAELRRIGADPALDSAERDSAREATLRASGVSPAELEAMARELARDPQQALEAWREIERQQARDTTLRAPAVRKRDIQ